MATGRIGKTRTHNRCGGKAKLTETFGSEYHKVVHYECECGETFAVHFDKQYRGGWEESAPLV